VELRGKGWVLNQCDRESFHWFWMCLAAYRCRQSRSVESYDSDVSDGAVSSDRVVSSSSV